MSERKVYLGPKENKLIMTLEMDEKTVFTIADAKEILGSSGSSVKKVIYRLKEKSRITEIERGKYLLSPARSGIEGYWSEHVYKIVPALISEYYISYWSALNFWEMTEQIPRVTYVATPKVKKEVEVKGQFIKFVTVDSKKFYGHTEESIGDAKFNIATREKTIVDCLDRLDYSGGIAEVAKGLWSAWERLDSDELIDNTLRYPNKAVQRRLGFLLEKLELGTTLRKKLGRKFIGYRWLDYSARKKRLGYDKTWGLVLNMKDKELLDWKG